MKKEIWRRCIPLVLLALIGTACSGGNGESAEKIGDRLPLSETPNEVAVVKLEERNFHHELVSNGKVVAKQYADLYFRTPETVSRVLVKNGDHVRKGQQIAELDLFRLNNTLSQYKNNLEQATLEMQDVLIGQGYSLDNQSGVPVDVMNLAKVKSGYEKNLAQYEASQRDLQQATLIAPFDGVVANLFDKVYCMANTSEPFCRVIDTNNMEVDFTILESELSLIKIGDEVEVSPYASAVDSRTGVVDAINPLVDDNGMVKVRARINGSNKLFDGMNVRIHVKRSVPNQVVVPKTAVVLRSGKQVLFTVRDGKAVWNYVHTGLENLMEYTLVDWRMDGLNLGEMVITAGNADLAHDTPVKVIE